MDWLSRMTKRRDGAKKGRPALGVKTRCAMCEGPQTRWLHTGNGLVPSCTVCYNREVYEPKRRRVMDRKVVPYSPNVTRRAATMLRKGATWAFVCDKVGVGKRDLTLWMGRLASTETF